MDEKRPEVNLKSLKHDLQSPLGGIHMLLNLLKDETIGPLNEAQAQVVNQAMSDCDRLREFIDIQDFS